MKNILQIIVFSSIYFLFGCQKGENILGSGYGKLDIKATISNGSSPILVQLDEKTIDTISENKSEIFGIVIKEGQVNFKLLKEDDKQILIEVPINIQAGKTTVAPPMLFDGKTALFDDLTTKPEKDSLILRFINLNQKISEVIDIKIYVINEETGEQILVKDIKEIKRDKFSNFVQLPSPKFYFPTSDQTNYNIAILDSSNGNIIRQNAILTFRGSTTYFPNFIASFAIVTGGRGGNIPTPSLVFERINE